MKKLTNYQKALIDLTTDIVTHKFKDPNIECTINIATRDMATSVNFFYWDKNIIVHHVCVNVYKSRACNMAINKINDLFNHEEKIFEGAERLQ